MKQYKKDILDILNTLDIQGPQTLRMDQKQLQRIVTDIKIALDTYDPPGPATGDALVGDVLEGKKFCSEAGMNLTGTLTVADLTSDATAEAADIKAGETAYVATGEVTGTLTVADLTSDATAEAADIKAGETAYTSTGLVTGTLAWTHERVVDEFEIGDEEFPGEAFDALTMGEGVVTITHDSADYKFVPVGYDETSDTATLVGGLVNELTGAAFYIMAIKREEGVAAIEFIKDDQDADVTQDWAEDSGIAVYYTE